MTLYADIIEGARFRADLVGSDRVSPVEWIPLAVDAVRSAWRTAARARPDFQVSFQDFTIASSQSAKIDTALIPDFFGLIDVVANPDTQNEFSLGPFAWANRRAPGNWAYPIFSTAGAQRARLMGSIIYLEPSISAGATYRVWYCPAPPALTKVRLATVGPLTPGTWLATSNELTSGSIGVVAIDGFATAVGDKVLVKDQQFTQPDDGPFTVNRNGAGNTGDFFRLAPYLDFTVMKTSALFYPSEGAVNAGRVFAVANQIIIATDAPTYTDASIPPILEQFTELLMISAALPAVRRDDDLDPKPLEAQRTKLESEMTSYFATTLNANNGPAKMIDTDARGPRVWGAW